MALVKFDIKKFDGVINSVHW